MGLFDRFKKKTKAAADSNESQYKQIQMRLEKSYQKREEMLSAIEESKKVKFFIN